MFKIEIDNLNKDKIGDALRSIATFLDGWKDVESVEIKIDIKKAKP